MRKLRISSGVKTAIIILNEIFALLLIGVLILSSNYGANSGSWDDLLTHRTFEQSEYFQTQSVNQATRAIRAAVRATRFEENGVYDPQRFVNISEYAEKGVITGEYDSEGLYYRLGDLLNWAQSGWTYSTVEIDPQGYLTFSPGNSSNASALREDLEKYFITSDHEWNAYYQYYQNVTGMTDLSGQENYTKNILNEAYQPENYRNIVSYAVETGTDLSEIYEQMLHVGPKDVVIGISFPRYSMRILKALEFANSRSASVITLTDTEHSPINLYSSCNLLAKSSSAT